MLRLIQKVYFSFLLVVLPQAYSLAQCAMCRASVENNVSNGDTTVGASLNMGILYLFVAPYLLAGIVGFLWYRNSKKRKRQAI